MEKTKTPRKSRAVMITFVIVFFCGIMALALFLIIILASAPAAPSNNNGGQPDPTDQNGNGGTDLPTDPDRNDYIFASILNEGIITIFKKDGEKLDINLEVNSWQDISWSKSGKYIAVLGKREASANHFDVAVYSLNSKEWKWVTDFRAELSGATKPHWIEDTLFFMQGFGVNKWLHRYNAAENSAVLKIAQVDGNIVDTSSLKFVLVKSGQNFTLFNSDGRTVEEFSSLSAEDEEAIAVDQVYLTDSNKIIARAGQQLFKSDLETFAAVEFKEQGAELLCVESTDDVILLTVDEVFNQQVIFRYNTKTDAVFTLFEGAVGSPAVNSAKTMCNEDILLFQIDSGEGMRWVELKDREFEFLDFLNDSKEVSVVYR